MNFIDNYKKEIIKKLLSHKEILTVYCAGTNMPLVECSKDTFADRVYVFDSEEMLKKFVANIADRKLALKAVKYLQKDKMAFFTMLLTINVDEILFMDPTGRHVIQVQDIIRKRDLSNVPKEQRPLENPQLKLSGVYFMQEVCRNVPKEEKNLKELEEELSANIVKGTFLVPITMEDPASGDVTAGAEAEGRTGVPGRNDAGAGSTERTEVPADPGTTASDDPSATENPETPGEPIKKQIRIPLIKSPQGDLFQPIFTDHFEFARYNKGNVCKAMAVPFVRLKTILAKECKGYMLNPNGFHLVITPQMLAGLEKRFLS